MSFLTQGSQGAAWRAASAALAPLAASSSASQTLVCALNVAHVCVLTGMFRAHVNNFATRSRAQRAYFSSPHSRRSPRRSPPCSARPRACGRSLYAMVRQWTIQAPITQPLTHRAADADAAGWRALCMHYCDHEPPQQASWRLVAHRNNKKLSLFYGVQTVNGCQRRNTQLTTHAYGCWRAAVSVHDRPRSVAACAELVGRVREPCSPRLIEALNDN